MILPFLSPRQKSYSEPCQRPGCLLVFCRFQGSLFSYLFIPFSPYEFAVTAHDLSLLRLSIHFPCIRATRLFAWSILISPTMPLSHLPYDLLYEITQYLDLDPVHDFAALACTNQSFYDFFSPLLYEHNITFNTEGALLCRLLQNEWTSTNSVLHARKLRRPRKDSSLLRRATWL